MSMELMRKRNIFLARLMVIIIISYLTIFGPTEDKRVVWSHIFIAFYLSTNLFFLYVPDRFFLNRKIFYTLVFFDSGMVSLGIYLSGRASTDFYLVYFLIIGVASMSTGLKYLMINSSLFAFLYGWILYQNSLFKGDMAVTYALRLPFIIIIALFFGYIVETIIKDKDKRLRESEEKYRQLFSTESDAIVIFDGETALVSDMNDAALSLYGYDRQEFLQLEATGIAADLGEAIHDIKEIIDGNTRNIRLQYHKKKDGTLFPAEVSAGAFAFHNRRMISTVIRDITERKQAEEELEKHRYHLEDLIEERTAQLVAANEKLTQEIEQRKRAEEALEKLNLELEERVEHRTIEISRANALLIGEMVEHARSEKALLESEERYRTVLEASPDPVVVYDMEGKVIYFNPAFTRVFRWTLEECFGKTMGDFVPKEAWPETKTMIDKVLAGESFSGFQTRLYTKEGNIIHVSISGAIYRDRDGNPVGSVVNLRDITEAKLIEKQLIQSEKLASLGLLVSGITHEINNPNSFIGFNIPILREYLQELMPITDAYAQEHTDFELFGMAYTELREDIFKLLDNMEHGSKRINAIVSGLREFISGKDLKDVQHGVDIKEVIEKAVAICLGQIKKRVKSFEVNIHEDLPSIHTASGALEQVLVNMLANAVQAADKADSSVKVDVFSEDTWQGHLVVEVSDNGCGMDEETRQKIFDPFFTTKRPDEGTGLGLYVCHNLVEGLGGRIEVESELGKGSCFRVVLPMLKEG